MVFLKKFLAFAVLLVLVIGIASVSAFSDNAKIPVLEKKTFIHYKKANAKPPWAGGGNGKSDITCYTFLSKNAKWKTVEDFKVNPLNGDGLSSSFVLDSVNAGIAEWENYGGNIFGSGAIDYNASYNSGDFDGVNTVSFGDLGDPNAIAVTTVWGYFSGPPQTRELLEWDMLFNDASFSFGNSDSNSSKMDFLNIFTHEQGHSSGLGDLYDSGCLEETMYGYSTEGETKKRSLNAGDIEGIQKLYA